MSASIRFPTPEPRSRASITGWRITTLNTRIPGWAIAHPGSTLHRFNKPRVRSNGVNSSATLERLKLEYLHADLGKASSSIPPFTGFVFSDVQFSHHLT